MTGKVYLLKKHVPLMARIFTGGPFTSHYKIGKTKNDAESRLSDARTGSSYPVSIYEEYVVNDHHAMEARLHRIFKHRKIQKRGRNEWYYLSPLDLMAINAIIKGRKGLPTINLNYLAVVIGVLLTIAVLLFAAWDGYIL